MSTVGFPDSTVRGRFDRVCAGVPERVAMAVTGHLTRSMFASYNVVSDDLRMAAQKTTMYVDTLPIKRVPG